MKPQLPSNLRHCDPLPEFTGENFGDAVMAYFELIYLYKNCNNKSEAKNVYFDDPSN